MDDFAKNVDSYALAGPSVNSQEELRLIEKNAERIDNGLDFHI